VGTHKTTSHLKLTVTPLKIWFSGTTEIFLIALKLAQFEFLKQSGVKPILLFDDIFDKLDESRVAKIIEMVNSDTLDNCSSQTRERTEAIVKSMHQSYKIFNL
jgi:DNA replication and repair protein RecF